MMIQFFVPGIARTAGSKSAFKSKDGRVHLTHAGKYSKGWMDSVKWFAIQQYGQRTVLLAGPITLKLIFFMARPKGHFRTGKYAGELKASAPEHPTTKPDLTKLTRAVEDAITGIIWKDDSQVVRQDTEKVYCGPEDKVGVYITIASVEDRTAKEIGIIKKKE